MGEKLCQALPVKSVNVQTGRSFISHHASLSFTQQQKWGEIAKEEKTEPRTSAALKCPHENLLKTLFSPFICSCNQRRLNTLEHGKFTELSLFIRLHAECGRTFSFFNICIKPASWSIIQNSTGSLLPQSSLSVDRAAAERSQPGWKCVKKVEAVRSILVRIRLTVGWTTLRGAGSFDRRQPTWCPEPAMDYISHTSVETLKGTRTPSILEIQRVPKPRGQAEPSSCVILPSLWTLCAVQSPGQTFGGAPLEGTFKIVFLKLSQSV